MSERPGTADAVVSRLRRPAGRLRDMPIWSKLGLIMLVPTLATIFVGTNGLLDHIDEASKAEQARTMAALTQSSGSLVDHLQNERAYSVMTLSARSETDKAAALKLYQAEQPKVEEARLPYSQQRAALTELPGKLQLLLTRLDRNMEDLPALRSQVANGTKTVTDSARTYSDLVTDLLNLRDSAAQLAGDAVLSDRIRTAAAVARNKEFLSQQRIVVHQILGQQSFSNELRKSYTATRTGQDQALQTMRSVATDDEQAIFAQVVSGPTVRQASNYNTFIEAKTTSDIGGLTFNATDWDTAQRDHAGLVRQVESKFDNDILRGATDRRDKVQREVFLETSLLLGMLLLAILFAWLVARSMARSLRELRQGALTVAQYGLPHAVGRLRDPSLTSSQLTPAQIADQIAEPLPVRSRDEFGQVTEAFNAVHLEAVRTAAEQAALRSSVSTMFVNLARRSQILVDRLIGHLDRLERGEEDPDRLAELFQLDHLATRMRRNDENLLVLAGADSTRVQREPAALIDVLRAAQSEVEHYTRIEFGNIDRDIEVAAHAVNDMVHLVAELFDNATAFSPPDSHVMVDARRIGDRAVLYVEDRGIGISPEQLRDLNERLANPPMVDVAVSRMMGLVVVARLANRHGVRVELRPAPERGTVADCTLPAAVLVPLASAGRVQATTPPAYEIGRDQPNQQTSVPPRSPFGAPLALESGSTDQPGSRPFDPNPPLVGGGLLGAGRSVPAWSDLTGAGNGSSGNGNGFHPVTPNSGAPFGVQPYAPPAVPYGNDDHLPRRRTDEDHSQAGPAATIPRQLPANPENQLRGTFMPPVSAPPVSGPPVSAAPASAPPVSAPPVSAPPVSAPPVTSAPPHASLVSPSGSYPVVPPPTSAPPVSAQPSSGAPVSAPPPAWPPVAADQNAPAAPAVPESLAAALDMTAEIPRFRQTGQYPQVADGQRDDRLAQDRLPQDQDRVPQDQVPAEQRSAAKLAAEAARQAAASQAAAAQQAAAVQAENARREAAETQARISDETMELPIFRELESAWFRTDRTEDAKPANGTRSAPLPAPGEAGVTAQRYSTAEPARTAVPQQAGPAETGNTRMAEMSMPTGENQPNGGGRGNGGPAHNASGAWRTAADEGWQAARAASEVPAEAIGTTNAGLPKRTPMAQLVPGGIDRGGPSVQRRTPEAVRGLLSAYHRGVQRGRSKDQSTAPDDNSGGHQSSQAGKEHDA